MKKLTFFLVSLLVFTSVAFAGDSCQKVARELHTLQNQIVDKSFRHLKKGAWGLYDAGDGKTVKAVYCGRQVSPKTGKKYDMIELQGRFAGQVWYRLTPKDVRYSGITFRFWTLEPMEIYAQMASGLVYISKREIELFMQLAGRRWSTILKEGVIVAPPDCRHIPVIKVAHLKFPGGKMIDATVIKSTENRGEIFCSPEVPFGYIKVRGGHARQVPRLLDFGSQGGKRRISHAMAAKATPLINPNKPGTLNLPGFSIQIRGSKK